MKQDADPLDVLIGARIRRRRSQLGLSQGQLGEKLKVTFQQVQKYEKGVNRVAASRIAAMAVILQVPNTYFFSGAIPGEEEESAAIEKYATSIAREDRAVERLLAAFNRIKNAENRKKVVAIVEAVADAFAGNRELKSGQLDDECKM